MIRERERLHFFSGGVVAGAAAAVVRTTLVRRLPVALQVSDAKRAAVANRRRRVVFINTGNLRQ